MKELIIISLALAAFSKAYRSGDLDLGDGKWSEGWGDSCHLSAVPCHQAWRGTDFMRACGDRTTGNGFKLERVDSDRIKGEGNVGETLA